MKHADDPGRSETPLGSRFEDHLRTAELFRPEARVLVAVSGGLDSVVLFHLLRFIAAPWRLRLAVAHFDHAMRLGSAADGDWVAGLCRAWEVPLHRARAEHPLRSEAEARSARYEFLRSAADDFGSDHIATAHHADDQAETVLFRIIRGTGTTGLAGIPERRGKLVRPLLPFRRAELAAYARTLGLRFRVDPTNQSTTFARNRLRHEVLPVLEEIRPGATDALVRIAAHARSTEEAWDWVLDRLGADVILVRERDTVELARSRLLSYHPHIRARLLRRLLRHLGSRPDQAGTRTALAFITSGASGGVAHVTGSIRLEREFDRIRIRRASLGPVPPVEDRPLVIEEDGDGEGEAVIGGRRLVVRWTCGTRGAIGETAVFDARTLRFPLEMRTWRPGDSIRLSYGTKKLKKLFVERRVGRSERARRPVLAGADGRTLWVVGLARAHGTEPARNARAFEISVSDAAEERG